MANNVLRILAIIDNNPFNVSSATNNRFLSLTQGLVSNSCIVDLIFVNGYLSNSEYKKYKHKGKCGTLKYKYVYSLFMRNKYIRKIFKVLFFNILTVSQIKKTIINGHYDYVWIGADPNAIKVGLELFKLDLSVKYFHERNEYSWIGISDAKLHQQYLRNFIPSVDILSVMTDALSKYYSDFVSEKTKIIKVPMTVDFSRFDILKDIECTSYKTPYIGYCGSTDFLKDGVDVLVKAFINIKDKYPELNLYIAGEWFSKDSYNLMVNIINEAVLSDRVFLLGLVPKEEIPQFLLNASILALARPESTQAEGGFPTKLGEYLATGNPVCVTNVGEICNYLSDNQSAFVAKPNCINSFSDALERALVSPVARSVGEKGREIAYEYFNIDIQVSKLLSILTETVDVIS
mgnify:CR=1 FL=1